MKHMTQDSVRIAAGVTAFDAAEMQLMFKILNLLANYLKPLDTITLSLKRGVQVTVLGRIRTL
ncbi:hypothetical protein [Erysipelothrix piscisicarius]|uniref:hypothetical protein n=1 Tax=Erysipelothrix piscisicarius TaxID=2485784 RepID=UPI001E442317|nr:hypothetical protein [Erysipelothrix piscisicarius]